MVCILSTYVKQKKQKEMKKETTLAMILPSCMNYKNMVEKEMDAAKLKIESSATIHLTQEQAEELCAKWHEDKSFESRVKMLSSAEVKVYQLSGNGAVKRWNNLIGPEDPADSKGKWAQLRCKFADAIYYALSLDNGFYGSKTESDAERELGLMKKWGYLKTP